MAFNYAASRATAERLLANFGQTVTLRKRTISGGAAWAPEYGSADTPVIAVDLNQINQNAPGSLAEKVTRKLLVSTSAAVTPETNDRVQIGAEWHTIGLVMPLAPGGTVIMYDCELVD